MKRIFVFIAVIMGLIAPLQAQYAPISKSIGAERKMMRKAPATEITVDDITGTYDATGRSLISSTPDPAWSVTITADENDANKVWIHPICIFSKLTAADIDPVYATLNADGTLSMPLGQTIYNDGSYQFVIGASPDGKEIDITTDIVMSITLEEKKTTITFAEDRCFGVGNILRNEWWYHAISNVIFAKEAPIPSVYIYQKGVEVPSRIKASQLFFNEVEGEMCVTNTAEYKNEAIAGTYQAFANSAFKGYPDEQWTMTITRDEADANKVWLHPICMINGLDATDIAPVYATFDEAAGTITMPLSQTIFEIPGQYKMDIVTSVDGENLNTTGEIVMKKEGNVISFASEYIFGAFNMQKMDGWYQALQNITLTSDAVMAIPVADIERITREKPANVYTYIKPGSYTWNYGLPISESELEMYTSNTTFEAGEQFDLSDIFEGTNDMIGTEWTVTGLFDELNLFIGNDEEPTAQAISYNISYEGETIEVLSILDPQNTENFLYSSLGKIVVKDDFGEPMEVDLYLGDFNGSAILQPTFLAYSEDHIVFDGTQLVLFYFGGDGYAYLYKHIYEMSVAPAAETSKPMQAPVVIEQNIPTASQGIPVTMPTITHRAK